jgi:hypothetical protein
MDMDCGRWFSKHLKDAVDGEVGGLGMRDVDSALTHLFLVHMRLGEL